MFLEPLRFKEMSHLWWSVYALITSIDKLLINTWSIFNRHRGQYSIDPWSISLSTVGRDLTNFYRMICHWVSINTCISCIHVQYMSRLTLGRLSTNCQSSVNQVSIKKLIVRVLTDCCTIIDWDANQVLIVMLIEF